MWTLGRASRWHAAASEPGATARPDHAALALAALRQVALDARGYGARVAAGRALTVRGPTESEAAVAALVTSATARTADRMICYAAVLRDLLAPMYGPETGLDVTRLAAHAGLLLDEDASGHRGEPADRLANMFFKGLLSDVADPQWRIPALAGLRHVAREAADLMNRIGAALKLERLGEREAAVQSFLHVGLATPDMMVAEDTWPVDVAISGLGQLAAAHDDGARAALARVLTEAPLSHARCLVATLLQQHPHLQLEHALHAAAMAPPEVRSQRVAEQAVNTLVAYLENGHGGEGVLAALRAIARAAPEPTARRSAAVAVYSHPDAGWPEPTLHDAVVEATPTGEAALHAALLSVAGPPPTGSAPLTVASYSARLAPVLARAIKAERPGRWPPDDRPGAALPQRAEDAPHGSHRPRT